MAFLVKNEILDTVKNELEDTINSVRFITAFCKENTFQYLSSIVPDRISDKSIMIRLRLDDLLNGATDFSVINSAIDAQWKVYIKLNLHAKTYIFDNKKGIVTSANLTNKGLSLIENANYEIGALVDLEEQDNKKITSLFESALLITNEIYAKLFNQYEQAKQTQKSKPQGKRSWDSDITELFSKEIKALFTHELPEKNIYSDGDTIGFLNQDFHNNTNNLLIEFRFSNAYLWLINILKTNNNCLYFGELTELLHETLINDPKPYRKDVKQLLANLLSFIAQIQCQEIVIDRPNHSQRIRYIENPLNVN